MKLKPCPFCGGEANIQEDNLFGTFIPYCPNCLTQKGRFSSRESAIEAWNRREPMDKIVEQLEEAPHADELWVWLEDAIRIVKGGAV